VRVLNADQSQSIAAEDIFPLQRGVRNELLIDAAPFYSPLSGRDTLPDFGAEWAAETA
jgi:hypothetical protein